MQFKLSKRVQGRQSSSSVKPKSPSVVASISKSIRKCHCCILQCFFELGQCFVLPEHEEEPNCTEHNVGPKIHPQTPLLHPRAVVTKDQQKRKQRGHLLLPPLVTGKKRTIVLDMDHTLVHSVYDPPPTSYDFMITPTAANGVARKVYVLKRPGVDEFLEAISKKYEVVVFTAGTEAYASSLLDVLDPKGLISHRLYRDSCRETEIMKFTKDLSNIGRELAHVVIVDDNPRSYCLQPENGIPVKKFEDDVEDRELEKLLGFFETYCDGFDDMRDAVKQYFGGAPTPTNKPVSSIIPAPEVFD